MSAGSISASALGFAAVEQTTGDVGEMGGVWLWLRYGAIAM
ncbi:hypothetical protein [Bifidobacterium sp.]|nr:hypothetical protein [Bifidobacterium sp.]